MTRFKVEAHAFKAAPEWFTHTFYVETTTVDEAAARAIDLATSNAEDQTIWVFLGRADSPNVAGETPEVREFQKQWLRDHAGMIDNDKVMHSVRMTSSVAMGQ